LEGELVVDLSNGNGGTTQLQLTNILYSMEVGYTLVSVGKLDNASFTATISGQKCTIRRQDGGINEVVEVVQNTLSGVYKVEQEEGIASAAEERLTLEKFHCHMAIYHLKLPRNL